MEKSEKISRRIDIVNIHFFQLKLNILSFWKLFEMLHSKWNI